MPRGLLIYLVSFVAAAQTTAARSPVQSGDFLLVTVNDSALVDRKRVDYDFAVRFAHILYCVCS